MPPQRRGSKSPVRRTVDLLVFVAIVVAGGFGLVPLYHWLRPAQTGSSAAGATSPTKSAAPAAPVLRPAGVMFDDFHYTGLDDASLRAHGWQARTAAGGPGIADTWSKSGVTFPKVSSAQGGQAMQLSLTSDGTKAGTRQAEIESVQPDFHNGTYAARIYFTDGPAIGANGDHINESFYAISAPGVTRNYSELDNEYMPNGGWGSVGAELDTTSWHSAKEGDRAYQPTKERLHGWHTVAFTSLDGKNDFYLDGKKIFSSGAAYSLHGPVDVAFSTWLIDLPFTGARTWNMQVNWFYYQGGKALTASEIDKAVDGYYASSTHYVNTLTKS